MKLSQLIAGFSSLSPSKDPDIRGLTADSRQVEKGFIFFATVGEKSDGHEFLRAACDLGAAALVVEKSGVVAPPGIPVIQVQNTRKALDAMASRFYGEPSSKLFCVGVTGTNGKTTTTHMIETIFNRAGVKAGVIGTINHHLEAKIWPAALTTPDPIQLQSRLRDFVQLDAGALAMEVSSHALEQNRVDSVEFDTVVFTNLTRDHLDYHGTMERYFLAKEKLFSERIVQSRKPKRTAIINEDDEYGRRLRINPQQIRKWSYGRRGDFSFSREIQEFSGSRVHLKTPAGECELHLPMPGLFNIYNALAAIAAGFSAGIDLVTCCEALQSFAGVAGRLQLVPNSRGLAILVDYAHTDDALKNSLLTLKTIRDQSRPGARILVVFGCGGDRDPGKRPMMMAAARQVADLVFLTSDNPRTEDPQKILTDCLVDVPTSEVGKTVICQVDRRAAIAQAIAEAKKGDVVLIAGKGHEDYQIIGFKKIPFSDANVVKEILQ